MSGLNVTQQISLKDLQAKYDAQEAALPVVQPSAPIGVSHASTIASASSDSVVGSAKAPYFPQLKPKLIPPNIQKNLVDMYCDIESSVASSANLSREWLKEDGKRHEELMRQNFEALQKEAEIAASQKNWNALKSIAQYITYFGLVIAPVAGGAAAAAGTLALYAARALQAAAGFGLIQKIGDDTGLTRIILDFLTNSKATQARIESNLSVFAAVASFATFILAWQTNVLGMPTPQTTFEWLQKISSFGGAAVAVSQLGVTWNRRKRTRIQADMIEHDVAKRFNTKEMEQRMQDVQQYTKTLDAATTATKTALENTEIHTEE